MGISGIMSGYTYDIPNAEGAIVIKRKNVRVRINVKTNAQVMIYARKYLVLTCLKSVQSPFIKSVGRW